MKIGVVIMLAELRSLQRAHRFTEIREMALRAEGLGLDSIWLYDHLLYRPESQGTIGIWECWTMLSALAVATSRVELGTLVVCNSFSNPGILVKMAETVDEISNGRLILGLGAGWNKPEYEAFGIPYDHRVSRFEEALQVIKPLLADGRVDYAGQYYQMKDCEIRPRGPRPGKIPLLVGCSEPRMLRLTAKYADMLNVGYMSTSDTFIKYMENMKSACEEVGRDPNTLEMTALISLGFPDLIEKMPEFEHGVLSGKAPALAEAMRGYEALGLRHIMFHLIPYSNETLERLGEAVRDYKM